MKSAKVTIAIAIAALSTAAHAIPPQGARAPAAVVQTLDGKRLDTRKLQGKTTVIFYESKDATAQNGALKAALARQDKTTGYGESVQVVAVADVSAWNFWPAKGFVQDAVREKERESGHPIFLDWSGEFGKAFGMIDDKSNVVVVGADGKVNLSHAGPVPADKALQILKATAK